VTPRSDELHALDASFLYMETAHTPMHMASVGLFEGPPLHDTQGRLCLDEVRTEVASRLHLVPKLRRCVRMPLVAGEAPVWVDDPDFDVANHVHQAALPSPGNDEQLFEFCADLMAYPMDRQHPLWHIWLVDGLEDGRVAVVELLHHSLADGLAGVELATVLLDVEPRLRTRRVEAAWQPAPPPSRLAVATRRVAALVTRVSADVEQVVRHPTAAPRVLRRYIPAFTSLFADPVATVHCSLNRRVGFSRRVLAVRRPLEGLRRAEHHFGVTLNDLLLTAVAAGVHDLLSGRGEVMEGRHVHVLVPVGADHHGDRQLGNEVSAMVVPVPIGPASASDRLERVAGAERRCKEVRQALAAHALLSSFDAWPHAALAAASHLVHRQPFVNLVVTNVPGPDVPLSMLGARMVEAVPLVPLIGNLSVGIAALSYWGQLSVGILVDPAACPDATVLASAIGRSLDELAAAARDGAEACDVTVPDLRAAAG
jgi:diacylglycerol O-acyltransferase / wax synthase